MTSRQIRVYPIPNPYTREVPLERQVELGICDFEAEDELSGNRHSGRTAEEARRMLIELTF